MTEALQTTAKKRIKKNMLSDDLTPEERLFIQQQQEREERQQREQQIRSEQESEYTNLRPAYVQLREYFSKRSPNLLQRSTVQEVQVLYDRLGIFNVAYTVIVSVCCYVHGVDDDEWFFLYLGGLLFILFICSFVCACSSSSLSYFVNMCSLTAIRRSVLQGEKRILNGLNVSLQMRY